jgi:Domain of unknown function (DUF4214)
MPDISGVESGEEFLRGLFEVLFEREPSCGEMKQWLTEIGKGATPSDIAEALLATTQFQSAKRSDEQFVTILYRVFLDRFPSTEDGTTGWIAFVRERGRDEAARAFRHGEEITNRFKDFRWSFPDMSRFGNGRLEIRDGRSYLKLTLGNAPEGLEIDAESWASIRPFLEHVGLFGLVRVGNELVGFPGNV